MSSSCKQCGLAREWRGAVRTVNKQEDSYFHLSKNSTKVNSIPFPISFASGRQSLVVFVSGLSCNNKIFLLEKNAG